MQMSERISDPTHRHTHTPHTHTNDLLLLPTLEAHLSRRRWRPTTQTLDPAALVVLHKNKYKYKKKQNKNTQKIPKRNTRQIKQTAAVACAAASAASAATTKS